MMIQPLSSKPPKPLYIVSQHVHTSLESAYRALQSLNTAYPSVRFGLLQTGGKWLVYRVHEQNQQAYRASLKRSD